MLERWSYDDWPTGAARPLPRSYWVRPAALLAGAYPAARLAPFTGARLGRLLDAGVSCFVDLTQAGEAALPPYEAILAAAAARRGLAASYLRAPIPDFGVPEPAALRAALAHIDAALLAGRRVYLHCRGGVGRTGTVVGCHLVRHGLTGPEALALIARLRRPLPGGRRASPETEAQRALVLAWGREA